MNSLKSKHNHLLNLLPRNNDWSNIMTLTISASLVKELRERTGAGMMECKRALEASQGNIETAIEAMRKSGQAKADKKADRITAEGVIVLRISDDGKHGILLEVNCETDFVARDTNFLNFTTAVAEQAIQHRAASIDSLLTLKINSNETVDEARRALVSKLGENIQIRRYQYFQSSRQLAGYSHGSRIAALVEIEGGDATLGKDIAMHIVANSPIVVTPEQVSSDVITKEKEIYSAQAASSGKPANIVEKMVEGRVKKYLEEISLVGQPFLKDPEQTVGKLLTDAKANVHSFVRFAVGEGIEKKTGNFAEEVMAQVKGG
jgi:elongation factor Ts